MQDWISEWLVRVSVSKPFFFESATMNMTRRNMLLSTVSALGATLLPAAAAQLPPAAQKRNAGALLDLVSLDDFERAARKRMAFMVASRVPMLVDGGIRRGTDVLKALALGAKAVLIGRPYIFGLAAGGAAGVSRVVEILRDEFKMAMALTGRRTLAEIDRSVIG